ncbi:hypothetical protein ACFONN_19440 [Dyella humi]|uniref:DUF4145 domain-containing protein n=1 Tax=Dyella humi TaxID=1770547 RepID=A0ABW8IEF0_9GAMM
MNYALGKQPQTKEDRWEHLTALDDELLKGGVILSEWCTFIIRDSDMAFVGGAHLSCILTAVSGIETYLRSEYGTGKDRLMDLINNSLIDQNLKDDIHRLRLYRNKWVHVGEPWDDELPLTRPEQIEQELEQMAFFAVKALRNTIYENQWV